MNPITAPYTLMRRGIFYLIYPARFMHMPTAKEREDKLKEPEIEMLYSGIYKINLRKTVANNINNPFKMDIDCCMLYDNDTDLYDKNKQYVIHCDGNATCYEDMVDEKDSWCDKNRSVVLFNPPGVKFSPGYTNGPEDYMHALKCMIEHLHAQGIPYENITLSGRSLGAAIATMVAADYHQQDYRIKLFNDRSFANMADESATYVKNLIPTTILRATLGNFLYLAVNGLVRLFGINFSPAKAFIDINTKHPGDARCIAVKGDRIIPKAQSLYAALPIEIREKYADMYEPTFENGNDPHNFSLQDIINPNIKKNAHDYLINFFEAISPRKKMVKIQSVQAKELLNIICNAVAVITKVENQDFKISTSELKVINETLNMFQAKIGVYIEKIRSNNDQIIKNGGDEAIKINDMIQDLIMASKKVKLLLENTQKQVNKTSKINKKLMLFKHKKDTNVYPDKISLKVDVEQVNDKIEQIIRKNIFK